VHALSGLSSAVAKRAELVKVAAARPFQVSLGVEVSGNGIGSAGG